MAESKIFYIGYEGQSSGPFHKVSARTAKEAKLKFLTSEGMTNPERAIHRVVAKNKKNISQGYW